MVQVDVNIGTKKKLDYYIVCQKNYNVSQHFSCTWSGSFQFLPDKNILCRLTAVMAY